MFIASAAAAVHTPPFTTTLDHTFPALSMHQLYWQVRAAVENGSEWTNHQNQSSPVIRDASGSRDISKASRLVGFAEGRSLQGVVNVNGARLDLSCPINCPRRSGEDITLPLSSSFFSSSCSSSSLFFFSFSSLPASPSFSSPLSQLSSLSLSLSYLRPSLRS